MMDFIDKLDGAVGIVMGLSFSLLVVIAIIRSIIRLKRGEDIDIEPIGIVQDLPSSVTGINKHKIT